MIKRTLSNVVALLLASQLFAGIITREEALRAAFPGAEIRYAPVFLTDSEMKEVSAISGTNVTTALVARYKAIVDQKEIGRAYLDTHLVRTKKESLLVILTHEGKVRRVEVVAFLEPPEYMAPDRWYRQFDGKDLENGLRVNRDIHAVTGASLTAQATTDAVRRVLAIDRLALQKERGNG
jgi:hypothetical protein